MEQTISPRDEGDVALLEFLETAYASARERWPGVELTKNRFAAHLGSVSPDEGDLVAALERAHCDDLYLARACAEGDPGALRAFEAEIMPRVSAAIARVDGSRQFIEDIGSDLRVKFLVSGDKPAEITRYLGRGPLAHWAQVAAMRLAMSRKRKKTREIAMDLPAVVDTLLADDPEIAPFADQVKKPFAEVFAAALTTLSRRERNILRLYLIDGVSAPTIATMYRVHRATVVRWITAAREKVHRETRRRLAEAVQLEGTSFESVVGMMWDGMDLSLATWLGSAKADPTG